MPVKRDDRDFLRRMHRNLTDAALDPTNCSTSKTTELRRLKRDLEAPGQDYFVVYADALDYVDSTEPIDITDPLIALAGAYGKAEPRSLRRSRPATCWRRRSDGKIRMADALARNRPTVKGESVAAT